MPTPQRSMEELRLALDGSLLLSLLNGQKLSEIARTVSLEDEKLPERMLDLAGKHGLVVLAQYALLEKGVEHPEWREVADDLKLNSQVQVKAATEISAAFEAAGVRAVFAKGLALALTVYADPGFRPFVDMDMLIEPHSLKRAAEILRGLGYTLDPKSLAVSYECTFNREKLPGFPVSIDLHYAFTGGDGLQAPQRIPLSEILDRAQTVRGVRVPCAEDTILLSAANMPRKAAQPFMLIVDFASLTRANPDWETVKKRAREWHVQTALWLGFELARMHLNAKIDDAFMTAIQPAKARREWLLNSLKDELLWRSDKHKQTHYTFWFKLKCLDSKWDEFQAWCALPWGVLRKLKLTRTWGQKQIGGAPPLRSPLGERVDAGTPARGEGEDVQI